MKSADAIVYSTGLSGKQTFGLQNYFLNAYGCVSVSLVVSLSIGTRYKHVNSTQGVNIQPTQTWFVKSDVATANMRTIVATRTLASCTSFFGGCSSLFCCFPSLFVF